MTRILLCLFLLYGWGLSSADTEDTAEKDAILRVRTVGFQLYATASRLSNFYDLDSIKGEASGLEQFLISELSDRIFFTSGGASEINAYADSVERDNQLLSKISKVTDEAARKPLVTGLFEDLRAKVKCWENGQDWDKEWGMFARPWPALRVCVVAEISSKDGKSVLGYHVAANPFSREDDEPPNCRFPDRPPYKLCLPPGYYKIWLEKGENKIQPRYVSVGNTIAGVEDRGVIDKPEEIDFHVETE